ncbi:DNA polymerase IV [Cetobacterium sp. SF1]|uniref:DNA polymerase IV n=1 Tax=Cetobacterium sp. SF1 TaxID=3417654 RepID=UPI003CFA38F5
MEKDKVILHYDMDCFYASLEIRDNKSLEKKPLVVGGGIVTTASYEARKFGIKSAMSVLEAKKRCHDLIIIPVDKEKYIRESERIHNLIKLITYKVEFIALDEGYIDITDIIDNYSSKEYFAKRFKEGIYRNIGVTCSVGIGYNKLSAKIASDLNKPNGYFIFNSSKDFIKYISEKNIGIFPGVGKNFLSLLRKDNINKVKDIYFYSLKELQVKYGNSRGELIYSYSRGIDNREIEYLKPTHSIGHELTYRIYLKSEVEVKREIDILFEKSYERLIEEEFICKTLNMKIKYKTLEMFIKSKTLFFPTNNKEILKNCIEELMDEINYKEEIRLVGISFGNLEKVTNRQLSIKF